MHLGRAVESEYRPSTEPADLLTVSDRPLVSLEGFARFEQRARQRRITRRLDAARNAIHAGRFDEAHAALAEVREIDGSVPELAALAIQLRAALESRRPRPHTGGGALLVAAGTFGAIVLWTSWTGNTGLLQSYPIAEIAALAPVPEAVWNAGGAALDTLDAPAAPAPTTGEMPGPPLEEDRTDMLAAVAARPALPPPSERSAANVSASNPPPAPARAVVPDVAAPPAASRADPPVEPPINPQASVAAFVPSAAPAIAAAAPIVTAPPARVTPTVDDSGEVRQVLRRYQAAYERLDARLAQAVWPGVDRAALARAFEGLESQTLTFENCDVALNGATANAVCTGSTRYVPKVGSGDPRVEPLVWNFRLRKVESDWQIEIARAQR